MYQGCCTRLLYPDPKGKTVRALRVKLDVRERDLGSPAALGDHFLPRLLWVPVAG